MDTKEITNKLEDIVYFLEKYTHNLFENSSIGNSNSYASNPFLESIIDSNPELITDMVDGKISPPTWKFKDQYMVEFLEDYKQLWQSQQDSYNFVDSIIQLKPDLIMDVCIDEDKKHLKYLKKIESDLKNKIQFIGNNKCAREIEKIRNSSSYSDFINLSYCVGKLVEGGEMIPGCLTHSNLDKSSVYSPDLINKEYKKVLVALRACADLTDHAARFAAKNDFDYFVVERCCYGDMDERSFYYDSLNQRIPFNKKVKSLLSSDGVVETKVKSEIQKRVSNIFYSGPKNAFMEKLIGMHVGLMNPINLSEMVFRTVVMQAVSYDLALEMNDNGYDTSVKYNGSLYLIQGKKR